MELCLLHQTVLNINRDVTWEGGTGEDPVFLEGKMECPVWGQGRRAWVQGGGGGRWELWVSPEWSSFTRDDMVLVMESAATSRSLRRFLLVPEGSEQMAMQAGEHGEGCLETPQPARPWKMTRGDRGGFVCS